MDTLEKARMRYYHQQSSHYPDDSAQRVGWTNKAAQLNRFRALCHFQSLANCVLLDVGCGMGDLKSFLDERYSNFTYLGIDLIPDFIEKAQDRFEGVENTFFMQADFITDGLPEVDHIIASGAMNYQTDDLLFPYSAIVKLFSRVRKSMSFNLLREESLAESFWLKGYDKNEILNFCRHLTPTAELIIGYEEDDFTILMYK